MRAPLADIAATAATAGGAAAAAFAAARPPASAASPAPAAAAAAPAESRRVVTGDWSLPAAGVAPWACAAPIACVAGSAAAAADFLSAHGGALSLLADGGASAAHTLQRVHTIHAYTQRAGGLTPRRAP